MNKQGPNGIEWTDWTWNPVTGCLHGCDYCYARKMANRLSGRTKNGVSVFPHGFDPHFYSERLLEVQQPKPGEKVFVVSMGDLFGDWVPSEWIARVIAATRSRPDVTWQFLTKNPRRYAEFNPWPANCWLGMTATDCNSLRSFGDSNRGYRAMQKIEGGLTFLSLEPLLGRMWQGWNYPLNRTFEWVIIGAQTGPGAVKPEPEWITEFVSQYANKPVFMKSNLRPHWDGELRQEWPVMKGGA